MRLAANANIAVELRILGYQFPDNHTAEYDCNWLVIEGQAWHPRGNWSFRDPCLLTYEAARLADWLDSVAAKSVSNEHLGFIEPNLSFDVVVAKAGRKLQVTFALESLPPWASQEEAVFLEFPIEELNLAEAISEWREQLMQFPQRAKY